METNLQIIQSKIYEIRGQRVMLDFDLAKLYGIENKRLKEQVRRNIERFPENFMFTLSSYEWKEIKHTPTPPFAFTQEGIAMLSGILRSPIAIEINISIMRAFVAIRQLIVRFPETKMETLKNELKELRQYVEEVFTDYNDINEDTRMQIELINQALAELQVKNKEQEKRKRPPIGFIKNRF